MAKIYNETVIITLSTLLKDHEQATKSIVTKEFLEQLQAVLDEISPKGSVVEVEHVAQ